MLLEGMCHILMFLWYNDVVSTWNKNRGSLYFHLVILKTNQNMEFDNQKITSFTAC